MTDTPGNATLEAVRARYAAAATNAARGAFDEARQLEAEAACCGSEGACGGDSEVVERSFGAVLYDRRGAPRRSAGGGRGVLGCGVPTAVADLHEGETVLDLGSGAGADVLISARRVGPTGHAIGLDMTDEMLELARANAAEAASRTWSSSGATSRSCRWRTPAWTSSSPTA